jgi:hypothetical protein
MIDEVAGSRWQPLAASPVQAASHDSFQPIWYSTYRIKPSSFD